MADPQPAPPAAISAPNAVFLDLADWRKLAREDKSRVKGLGISWTPSNQSVRAVEDVPADMADYFRDFIITTSEKDRYDDVVELAGWDWTDYFKGGDGVVLLAHDRRGLSVGKCPWIKTIGPAMVGRCRFPTQAEIGYEDDQPSLWKTVRLMYVNGFMKNTSVGFMADEWTFDEESGGLHFIKQKGLEWSLCSVPANPGCYQLAKSAGIDVNPLREWAVRALDEIGGIEGVYISKARLERALKELGSEMGIAYFDVGEILTASSSTPKVSAPAKSAETKKKGGGKLLKSLEAAGLSLADLIAAAKTVKSQQRQATEPAKAEVAPEPVPAVATDLFLEIEESQDDLIFVVDEQGRTVEMTRDSVAVLVRGAFSQAMEDERTRVTGKVF